MTFYGYTYPKKPFFIKKMVYYKKMRSSKLSIIGVDNSFAFKFVEMNAFEDASLYFMNAFGFFQGFMRKYKCEKINCLFLNTI